jgi:hypothetical protein
MKRSLAIVTLVILALAVSVPLAWSQGGTSEQQIKTLFDQTVAAQLNADTKFFEKILADDYTTIRGDGSVLTKAQEIESYKSGGIKYEADDVKDLKIRIYGNTAVTTALLTISNIRNGKPYSGTIRSTRVWVKQKGNWKCVANQATRVSQ